MKTTEPIRNKAHVAKLLRYYHKQGQHRNHLLICLCLHTALRISDVLKLTISDIYDFKTRHIKTSITVTEKKTGKTKTIALHKNIIKALRIYLSKTNPTPNTPLIPNTRTNNPITRIQAYRLIRTAAESIEIPQPVSCHSLRKTFGYHAWKSGTSPAIIMDIYNHTSMATTKRYLSVAQDDKNLVYVGINFIK